MIHDGSRAALSLQHYREAVYSACASALDESITDLDALESRVRDLTDALDPIEETFLGEIVAPDSWDERRKIERELSARVASAPRGTWLIIRCSRGFSILASDGSRLAPGVLHDLHLERPSFDAVRSAIAGYEIYLTRGTVERDRQLSADLGALADSRIRLGAMLRDLTLAGSRYSSAMVTHHDRQTGRVRLRLAKRGSGMRWDAEIGADALTRILPAPGGQTEGAQEQHDLF